MKLKYSVYGNCQAVIVAQFLSKIKSFQRQYEYIPLKAVQTINVNEIESVTNIFSDLNLLIYQNISSNYRIPELSTNYILDFLPNNAAVISIPSLYFNGYFPHLDSCELKSITNFIHDFNIMAGYLKNISEDKLFSIIENINFYSVEEANKFLISSISNLKERESSNKVNISMSQVISKYYAEAKLFNHFNHPTGFLFSFLIASILENLSLPYQDSEIKRIKDSNPAGAISYSIYHSTDHHLKLKFSNDFANDKVKGLQNKKYSYRELIHAFYKFYDAVDNNLKLSKIIERKKPFILDKLNDFI